MLKSALNTIKKVRNEAFRTKNYHKEMGRIINQLILSNQSNSSQIIKKDIKRIRFGLSLNNTIILIYNKRTLVIMTSLVKEKFGIGIFLPVSTFLIFWYFFVLLMLGVDFTMTILVICFRNESVSFGLRNVVLPIMIILLFVDIFISLNTGFIRNGKIIREREQILKKYLFGVYFWIDVLAFLVAIIQLVLKSAFSEQFPFLNFLIFIKVIKAAQFDNLIKKYVLRSWSYTLYYDMIKNVIFLALVCHVIGSFFFYLDLVLIDNKWYPESQLWIYSSQCYANIIDLPFGYQYAYSFYYAVITLTGTAYGDLTPLNQTQTAYTFGSVALPMIVYSYIFAVIYNSINERRVRAIEERKYKTMTKEYFKQLGVSLKLRNKILNFLAYVTERKFNTGKGFMDDLAPSVGDRYRRMAIEGGYDFNIFLNLTRPEADLQLIKDIVYKIVEEEAFSERQVLLSKNRFKLYFITSGKVVHVIALKNTFSKTAPVKTFVGSYSFFTGILTSAPLLETNSFSVCLSLEYNDFKEAVKAHKTLNQSFHVQRDQILFENHLQLIKQQCFFCDERNHHLKDCPKLRPQIFKQQKKRQMSIVPFIKEKKYKRNNKKSLKVYRHGTQFKNLLEGYEKNREKIRDIGIQADAKQTSGQLKQFEEVSDFKVFFPQYSLS